jgi:prevent-host-death family protein
MQQVKITDLRAHLPAFLKKVSKGEQIQITSHGKVIARLVPENNIVETAQKRLDALRGTMIVGDIMETLDSNWSADADNL